MKKYAVSLIYITETEGILDIHNELWIVWAKSKKSAVKKAKIVARITALDRKFSFSTTIEII